MLSGTALDQALQTMIDRIDEVNKLFIRKVVAQIETIGQLSASSVHRLNVMADINMDVSEITQALQTAMRLNLSDMAALYQNALDDAVGNPRFLEVLKQDADQRQQTGQGAKARAQVVYNSLSLGQQQRVKQLTQAVAMQTANYIQNLSNTTAIYQPYVEAVDKAVLAVTMGISDYQSEMRSTIQALGTNGLKVRYASGYRRRLDSSVRQNILDGVKQINQKAADIVAEELGFDAVELSAHMYAAPDHEPVQGRVFLKTEFEKMQNGEDFQDVDGHRYTGFKRPIGEWNCMHFASPFSTKASRRRYTDTQLKDWADKNQAGCTINGKHMTTYEASQYMRALETDIRREKDAAYAAQQLNDPLGRAQCQMRIDAKSARYFQIAKLVGIPADGNRLAVEGFRPMTSKQMAQYVKP